MKRNISGVMHSWKGQHPENSSHTYTHTLFSAWTIMTSCVLVLME